MPWSTPTLSQVRVLIRDNVHAYLPGSDATVPNSVLRVMSDGQAALCHLVLQYIDWLSLQIMPDTAETVWLDRFGAIWLVNADGTVGRKQATSATGTLSVTGNVGAVVPSGSQFTTSATQPVSYQTTEQVEIGSGPTPVTAQAINAGTITNLDPGTTLNFVDAPVGVDQDATIIEMDGGTDPETDDELRARILARIRQPPMGGDATDYVQWALAVPGVSRAWAFPQEMGIGTMTVRFMMDELRADNGGIPLPDDVDTVEAYLNTVRPVTVKDLFVEAPIPYPVNVNIAWLNPDTMATHGAIEGALLNQFLLKQVPGQTWYRSWTDQGILNAPGIVAYDLTGGDVAMPSSGYMPVLGDITYLEH